MNKKTEESTFQCIHCNSSVVPNAYSGTAHRNHCPFCLWSLHVDGHAPGDRLAVCHGSMEPIGLTFKHEGMDKYGKIKQGELMIIHICTVCGKISINRIAGDDDEKAILKLLTPQRNLAQATEVLQKNKISILGKKDTEQVRRQLFGKPIHDI